jgi:hypothetical protein
MKTRHHPPELPVVVARYLERAIGDDGTIPRQVRIDQEGRMWQKPGGRAMRFTATERFAVDRVAVSWRARFPMLGPLAIDVVDEYADGDGRLDVRLLGIRLKRQQGLETSIGEALRYLAELPWAPYAIAHNPELEWRELDERAVEVETALGDRRLAVRIDFDGEGNIVRASSPMRPLLRDKVWRPTPWGGEFRAYETVGGVRLPTEAEVYWELDGERFTYWQGRVASVELLVEPFGA